VVCGRCGSGGKLCHTCRGEVERLVRRWVDGEMDLTAGELGREIGVSAKIVNDTALRIQKRRKRK
jgi:hypothetical protein